MFIATFSLALNYWFARTRLLNGEIVHSTGDGLRGNSMLHRDFLGKSRPFSQSFGFLAQDTGAACLPVFVRSDEFGAITCEICPPVEAGTPVAPSPARIAGMIDAYVHKLEQRWITDFGNVPAHALHLYDHGFRRGPQAEDS